MALSNSHEKVFSDRHIGPDESQIQAMLKYLGVQSLDAMIENAAPASILTKKPLNMPPALTEDQLLKRAWELASKNKVLKTYIGQGYYGTFTPSVILRNIMENPGWYTAYTPYQAEVAQGRMEALLNFQTMVADLTGMEVSNASLLDEGTAAAEAMTMAKAMNRKNKSDTIFVADDVFPQTLKVLETRALPLGIKILTGNPDTFDFKTPVYAAIVQTPGKLGTVRNLKKFIDAAKAANVTTIVGVDILSLCVLEGPGKWGADLVYGSTQRFGVPMGFGGPHAAFLATQTDHVRLLPGRLIGVSKDSNNQPALRLTLQTREQHIRREKATSNICTAQVLLAVMAGMYAVYHGPEGLKAIATRVHHTASAFAAWLKTQGFNVDSNFFDTLHVHTTKAQADDLQKKAVNLGLNLGRSGDQILIAFDETTREVDLEPLTKVFGGNVVAKDWTATIQKAQTQFGKDLERKSEFLTHPVFNTYHSETEMLRYIHRLEQKDLSLNQSMIALGSCTMKLNATSEMIPVTWPEFGQIHPFVPKDQAAGYLELIHELETWLAEITGFHGVSLQPNAGSQGEYAGLLAIRNYFEAKKESHRNICLIPSSAHGTNPASAAMAGMQVVVVKSDDQGNVDLTDLRAKVEQVKNNLAAFMITYPSTHGIFEEDIKTICEIIHSAGGQVYMDGANLNALVGIAKPGEFGPDVTHINMHKTFCIPHGGGGPGVGPIAVAKHLTPHIPQFVSAAPYGSASILPISWAYMAMMGADGLKRATQVAVLSANYIAKRLAPYYPVLYKSKKGWVAHECIIDTRSFKDTANVNVDDIAKRLIDFGFHAPTMSWPVPGTLMIEPTESESREEIDRFCEAMITIREEIREVEDQDADKEKNVLKNAPHTLANLMADEWTYSYSKEKAFYPRQWVKERKFWPAVGRVDNAYGDRNIMCSCLPLSEYESNPSLSGSAQASGAQAQAH